MRKKQQSITGKVISELSPLNRRAQHFEVIRKDQRVQVSVDCIVKGKKKIQLFQKAVEKGNVVKVTGNGLYLHILGEAHNQKIAQWQLKSQTIKVLSN